MATRHVQNLGVLFCLGLLLCACTAGQYDIQECDPSVPNLDKDLCNRLNDAMGLSGCMLYQCDNVTHRCVMKPRDYDRDGAPAIACGGCDCDDTDPTVYCGAVELCDNKDNNCNGVRDEGCSCNPLLIGTTCYDGKGACMRSGLFVCNANVPICTAMATDPQGWHNAVDLVNHSADWNCNGVDELTCCANSSCTQVIGCNPSSCSTADPNTQCAQFCQGQQVGSCGAATVTSRCDDTCGGRTLVCHCALALAFPFCQPSGSSFGVVGCQ